MTFKIGDVVKRVPVSPQKPRPWCDGKQKHPSQGAAEAQLRSLQRRGLDRPEEGGLRTYKCPTCFSWHTGHFTQQ